jgi:hypothetical protein
VSDPNVFVFGGRLDVGKETRLWGGSKTTTQLNILKELYRVVLHVSLIYLPVAL